MHSFFFVCLFLRTVGKSNICTKLTVSIWTSWLSVWGDALIWFIMFQSDLTKLTEGLRAALVMVCYCFVFFFCLFLIVEIYFLLYMLKLTKAILWAVVVSSPVSIQSGETCSVLAATVDYDTNPRLRKFAGERFL